MVARISDCGFRNPHSAIRNGLRAKPALWLTLGTNIIGFLLMQGALQAGRGVVVVPLFSTLSNLVPIIGGILLYREWEAVATGAAALRPLAFVLAIGGGALLAGFGEPASSSTARQI